MVSIIGLFRSTIRVLDSVSILSSATATCCGAGPLAAPAFRQACGMIKTARCSCGSISLGRTQSWSRVAASLILEACCHMSRKQADSHRSNSSQSLSQIDVVTLLRKAKRRFPFVEARLSRWRLSRIRDYALIPPRKTRKFQHAYDRKLYKVHHRIDDMFGHFREWRRTPVATIGSDTIISFIERSDCRL